MKVCMYMNVRMYSSTYLFVYMVYMHVSTDVCVYTFMRKFSACMYACMYVATAATCKITETFQLFSQRLSVLVYS